MAAKVDTAAVQDGYQLDHHAFFFSSTGHWLSESVTSFVNEPHEAICSDQTAPTLNLVAAEHDPLRSRSVELASGSPERVISLVRRAAAMQGSLPFDVVPTLDIPARHALELPDVDPRRLESVLLTTYERAPQDFETRFAFAYGTVRGADRLAS